MKNLIAFISLCTLSFISFSAEPIVGVGTHFAWKRTYMEDLLTWSKHGQIKSIRDEIYWKDVERTSGILKIEGRAEFALQSLTRAHESGLHPLIILGYGNPNYDRGGQPFTPEGRIAFARYAKFIYEQTKHLSPTFEIWNEWNIGAGTKPPTKTGSASDYLELVRLTTSELRKAGFKGKILGGALGDDHPDWPWAKQAISLGILDLVDGLSIHLYNYSNSKNKRGPTEFLRRTSQLNTFIKSQNGGAAFPIFITEMGWPNHFGLKGISQEEAARDAEIFLNELPAHPYIHGVWFYEFQDGGSDPFEKEHHFGLFTLSGEEKPIACAIRGWHAFQSKVKWNTVSKSGPLAVAEGFDLDGNLVTRVWPSPDFGHDITRFSIISNPNNKRRTVQVNRCGETLQPFSPSLFPSESPMTIVTPRGVRPPAFKSVN